MTMLVNMAYTLQKLYRSTLVNRWLIQIIRNIHGLLSRFKNVCNVLNLKIPNTSTIEDVTYTANMAYADFYPELLNEHQCIKYAAAVANDKDGYTGIQFCRWVADVVGKKENIDWDKFK